MPFELSHIARVQTLPDLIAQDLNVLFIGINPSVYSAERGHYFARPGNRFWPCFSASALSEPARAGLEVERLAPHHDRALVAYGIGFTDVVKRPTVSAAEVTRVEFAGAVAELLAKIRSYAPRFACFHGITGYRAVHEAFGLRGEPIGLGLQSTSVKSTQIFLAPNPSGANAHFTRADQIRWYDVLAALLTT